MPSSPQGDQGMDWWLGFSQCWTPGRDGCVVWWDAWAAAGALAAVITTAVLGVVTYRLGRAANEASQLAVSLAGQESHRQRARDRKERILLLLQITGEISTNLDRVNALHAHLSEQESEGYFAANRAYRKDIVENMALITFPLTEKLADRYHYLDDVTGPKLVRAIGLYDSMRNNSETLLDGQSIPDLVGAHELLCLLLPRISHDLEVVRAAAAAAVRECGIDDARIAAAALAYREGEP